MIAPPPAWRSGGTVDPRRGTAAAGREGHRLHALEPHVPGPAAGRSSELRPRQPDERVAQGAGAHGQAHLGQLSRGFEDVMPIRLDGTTAAGRGRDAGARCAPGTVRRDQRCTLVAAALRAPAGQRAQNLSGRLIAHRLTSWRSSPPSIHGRLKPRCGQENQPALETSRAPERIPSVAVGGRRLPNPLPDARPHGTIFDFKKYSG